MNILFYYPDKERAVSLSSLMIAFKQQGHNVFLVTHEPEGTLHKDVQPYGILCSAYTVSKIFSLIFYLKHIFYLARFTKKNQIDIVYSHIQRSNFISVFAQLMSPSRFIICRHHSDCAYIDNNRKERIFDFIINRIGKEFIVPSKKVFNHMVNVEKIKKKKIYLIRYAYNFNEYPKPDKKITSKIKEKYKCRLLLLKVARLIPEKRHLILFDVVRQLIKKNFDVKLLVLSEGRERENLEAYIQKYNLQNYIFILGYKANTMNYVAAADLVVHVSASEASNNFIKEVALVEKPVIVCNNVGDFDEYIINNINGITLSKENTEKELIEILEKIYSNKFNIDILGKNLKRDVLQLFSIEKNVRDYMRFNKINH